MHNNDNYMIDSHKLMYHPARVASWLRGGNIFPLYVEISPTNACNHDCLFCALKYEREKAVTSLDKGILSRRLKEMARLGVRSVMFAGSGEPLIHPDIGEMILTACRSGLDVALSTNGVLLDKIMQLNVLRSLSWIRISINAGTDKNYSRMHSCRKGVFRDVIRNIALLSGMKRRHGLKFSLGTQTLLLPDNYRDMPGLAKVLKKAGADYFSVKPYSEHPKTRIAAYGNIDYRKYIRLGSSLSKLEAQNFKILFRSGSMLKAGQERQYAECLGLPFFAYINNDGSVFPCTSYIGMERYSYGNINRKGFCSIWSGEKRKIILSELTGMNKAMCRINCRLDEINRYLWKIKNPPAHKNFI